MVWASLCCCSKSYFASGLKLVPYCPNTCRGPLIRETARTASLKVSCKAAARLSFRTGNAADAQLMRELVWKERMNPLGIAPERFIVAVDESGKLLGFGQLEQKDNYMELRSMVVDPSCRCHSYPHRCL